MSNHKLITINPTIYKTLLEAKSSLINIRDIKDAFLGLTKINISDEELTKTVYRQLVRLTQRKLLEKKKIKDSKNIGYTTTKLFENTEFKFKTFKFEQDNIKEPVTYSSSEQCTNDRKSDLLKTLNNQITQYEVDFQSSIAESEEYKRLFTIAPDLKTMLKTCFLDARDKSNKLLGKIIAVKKAIAHLESSCKQCN